MLDNDVISEGVNSDLVDISLKFGTGQFNSLSASKLLGIL